MKLRGTGVGSMFYGVGNTGLPNPAAAFVEVLPDTSVNVTIGAADIGQGVASVAAAIAAETLGLEFENVHVTWADTMIAPEGGATSASRQTFITGNAVKNACTQAMGELKRTASEFLNVPQEELIFRHREIYSSADESKKMTYPELMGAMGKNGRLAVGAGYYNPKTTYLNPADMSGIPYEAAEILTDKAKMKDAFRQGGVSAADGMRVRSAEEAQKAAEQLGYPVVVKRVDSSGSRGITVVEHSGQIEEAYENARNGSARDYVLVEKFLRGTEIGVDGFVQNHKLVFLAPHTKFVYRGAHTTVPVGHAFPYGCSGALREEIARQMQLAVTASGADQCSVNADVFVDGEKVWIIEMGGRTGATCIPELISTYYGFDFYEQMIKSALGEETDFQQTESCPCMAKLLLSPVSGTITQIDRDQVERLRQEGLELVLDYPEGHEVSAMADGTDRIGHVIVKTDREAELDEQMKRVYRCIWIDGKNLETIWEEKTAK